MDKSRKDPTAWHEGRNISLIRRRDSEPGAGCGVQRRGGGGGLAGNLPVPPVAEFRLPDGVTRPIGFRTAPASSVK
jgi:hypothetical protein